MTALALATTLAMGVAAAGGMSVLDSDDPEPHTEQLALPDTPPVVVAPEPGAARPVANPAHVRPRPGPRTDHHVASRPKHRAATHPESAPKPLTESTTRHRVSWPGLAERLRLLREHGPRWKHWRHWPGPRDWAKRPPFGRHCGRGVTEP